MPFRVIPERGQVTEDSVESANNECCNVFHDDVAWSQLANDAGEFTPQSASRSMYPLALADVADVLTGKPAGNHVHFADIINELVRTDTRTVSKIHTGVNAAFHVVIVCRFVHPGATAKLAHVAVDRDAGPVARQDATAKRINLAERHCFHACSFEPQ